MSDYTMVHVSDRKSKKAFCRMLNDFRNEYFRGESPFDVTPQYLDSVSGVVRSILFKDKRPVAILESCFGTAFGKKTLGVGTVYVKPSFRNLGVAVEIYDFVESMAKEMDMIFNIQIEESSLKANLQKFINMGFTHAHHIREFSNNVDYKEKTFALFKNNHGISALDPIREAA